MNKKIEQLIQGEHINYHSAIEVGSFVYGLFGTMKEAQEELDSRIHFQEAHPENYDSSHVDWHKARVRRLEIGDTYQDSTRVTHGIDDGYHESKRQSRSVSTSGRVHLDVNV